MTTRSARAATNPAGLAAEVIAPKFGKPLPGIMWDGIVNAKAAADPHICIANNGDAKFLNYDAGGEFKKPSTDLIAHACHAAGARRRSRFRT